MAVAKALGGPMVSVSSGHSFIYGGAITIAPAGGDDSLVCPKNG